MLHCEINVLVRLDQLYALLNTDILALSDAKNAAQIDKALQ